MFYLFLLVAVLLAGCPRTRVECYPDGSIKTVETSATEAKVNPDICRKPTK
jgi:hypothetical protein